MSDFAPVYGSQVAQFATATATDVPSPSSRTHFAVLFCLPLFIQHPALGI